MLQKVRKLHLPGWRRLRHDKRDVWLALLSMFFHLIVFMLLPQLATQAAARTELLLQLELSEIKPLSASARVPPSSDPLARPHQPDIQPARPDVNNTSAEPGSSTAGAPAQTTGEQAATEPVPAETQSESLTMPAIPEIISTPVHQPREHETTPVTQQNSPPAPAADSRDHVPPPAPAAAENASAPALETASESETGVPEPVSAEAPPAADSPVTPAPVETELAVDTPAGADSLPEGPPAPPPGPSDLELGLLEEYGDYARKRIRMLARTPERAKEQKLKGSVLFQFKIAGDGKLLSVKVLESSGYPVLDEECLEATRVASGFKRFPANVSVDSWSFKMKLEFPLY